MKPAFFNSTVDISDSIFITCDNMKVGTDLYATITDWVGYVLKIIHCKFLGDHINDLVSGRNICFILIGYQLVDFLLGDFLFILMPYDVASCL